MKFESNQAVFDHVVPLLLKQNERSEDRGGCAYRGPNGLKCAIGHCITDEQYDSVYEGKSASTVRVQLFDDPFGPDVEDEFLDELQDVHDKTAVSRWPERFARLAYEFNLNTKVLDEYAKA